MVYGGTFSEIFRIDSRNGLIYTSPFQFGAEQWRKKRNADRFKRISQTTRNLFEANVASIGLPSNIQETQILVEFKINFATNTAKPLHEQFNIMAILLQGIDFYIVLLFVLFQNFDNWNWNKIGSAAFVVVVQYVCNDIFFTSARPTGAAANFILLKVNIVAFMVLLQFVLTKRLQYSWIFHQNIVKLNPTRIAFWFFDWKTREICLSLIKCCSCHCLSTFSPFFIRHKAYETSIPRSLIISFFFIYTNISIRSRNMYQTNFGMNFQSK